MRKDTLVGSGFFFDSAAPFCSSSNSSVNTRPRSRLISRASELFSFRSSCSFEGSFSKKSRSRHQVFISSAVAVGNDGQPGYCEGSRTALCQHQNNLAANASKEVTWFASSICWSGSKEASQFIRSMRLCRLMSLLAHIFP